MVDEHNHEDNDDLAPEYLGRGHGEGSSVANPKGKTRIFSGVQTAAVGYNWDSRAPCATEGRRKPEEAQTRSTPRSGGRD